MGRIKNLRWSLSVDALRRGEPSDLTITVNATQHSLTETIRGKGLWKVGLYASADQDPLGPKERYQPQILSKDQQAMALTPDGPLNFLGMRVRFNTDGLGCGQLNYICMEFTRGDSPKPEFQLPLPQPDNDGEQGRIASCRPWPCQGNALLKPSFIQISLF